MKIAIIGYTGSGKSTLAASLADHYQIPHLHMDKISFNPNWKENSNEERIEKLQEFLNNNPDNWIIDGNYSKVLFEERMLLADQILFLDFNRFTCYFSARKRAKEYQGKKRESAPEGCNENFSLSFQLWILFGGRKGTRRKKLEGVVKTYPDKVLVFKNRKQVNKYLEKVKSDV